MFSYFFATSFQVYAVESDEQQISPYYNYTQSNTASLKISNSGTATCYSTITGYPNLTTKIKLTMYLEKKTLWWWSEETNWTSTVKGYYNSLSKNYSVTSGTYRLRVVYTVYSNSSSETITGYSKEVSI